MNKKVKKNPKILPADVIGGRFKQNLISSLCFYLQ